MVNERKISQDIKYLRFLTTQYRAGKITIEKGEALLAKFRKRNHITADDLGYNQEDNGKKHLA